MKIFAGLSALAVLGMAVPAHAQEEAEQSRVVVTTTVENVDPKEAELAAVMGMMGSMFETELLTAEEEARLPAARALVETIMPAGLYADMMGEIMDSTLRPMFTMFSGPDFVIAERTGQSVSSLESLSEEERRELAIILDPAYDRRADAMIEGMVGMMTSTFAVVEEPMKDGLSRAYAKRFSDAQMADVAAFFATETGAFYATESMKLFADPEVMGASMAAMPAVLGELGNMTAAIQEIEASLPSKRGYADLTLAQRATLTRELGMTDAELRAVLDEADAKAAEQAELNAAMMNQIGALEEVAE